MQFRRMIFAALCALGLAHANIGLASQATNCFATTGTVSGLQLVQNLNFAFASHISANSGSAPPATDCTGAPVRGQIWLDTSAAPYPYKIYDGASWLTMGTMDATAHQWRVRPSDGTLAAPGVGFASEPGTGLRRAGTGDLRLTVNGTDVLQVTTGGFSVLSGSGGSVPVGTVLDYSGSTAPSGYLLADGSCFANATYTGLSAVLGSTYGTCSAGQTRLPDLRGRVAAGKDNMGGTAANRLAVFSGTTLGAAGGDQNMQQHAHGISDPGHSHGVYDPGHSHSYTYPSVGGTSAQPGGYTGYSSYPNTATGTTAASGTGISIYAAATGITVNVEGSGNSQNVQPTIILNKIIKY